MSHAIGIDIGGTKIAAGLVDRTNGTILARRQAPSTRGDGAATLATAIALARDLHAAAREQSVAVSGIGAGLPELVDTRGIARSRYNFDWAGRSLADDFAGVAPTVIESDVRAAARAETSFGAGRGQHLCAYVTIGTGVSYCLCIDGQPYLGARGFAIHLASSPLSIRCTACGSVQEPVVEEVASGPGLARAYTAATGTAVNGAETVLADAAAGVPAALTAIEDAARLLGTSIGLMINMVDPQIVIVGGGLGSAGGPLWPAIVAATRAHIFADDARDLPIVRAALGGDAGIIGAALCAP